MSESVKRVFNIPAITWTLTAVLLLSGSYHLLQATRPQHLTAQVNKSLHALMSVLMAAMLWNLMSSILLAQIAVLAGAALWFVIQAVARPEFKVLCAGSQGRLKCFYHSLTMASAALMIAMMGVTTAGHGIDPAGGISTPNHTHHAMESAVQGTATTGLGHSPVPAILLTVFFGAAAAVFIVLLLRNRATKASLHNHATPKHSIRAEHGHEALGATIMALMFATMTA